MLKNIKKNRTMIETHVEKKKEEKEKKKKKSRLE